MCFTLYVQAKYNMLQLSEEEEDYGTRAIMCQKLFLFTEHTLSNWKEQQRSNVFVKSWLVFGGIYIYNTVHNRVAKAKAFRLAIDSVQNQRTYNLLREHCWTFKSLLSLSQLTFF